MSDKNSYFELNNNNACKKKWNEKINNISQKSIRWQVAIVSLFFGVPIIARGLMSLIGWENNSNNATLEWFTLENIDNVMKYIYSTGLIFCTTTLFIGLLLGRIKLKSSLDNLDAFTVMVSIVTFAIALFFNQVAILFILFFWINLYSSISRVHEYLSKQFIDNDNSNPQGKEQSFSIEKFFFWFIPVSLLFYYLSFNADITLSEIFKVDPKHFTNTKPLVMFIELTPALLLVSSITFIVLGFVLFRETENNKLISFFSYIFNILMLSALLFILFQDKEQLIRRYADTVDFNPKNICNGLTTNKELEKGKISGAIYLAPAYNRVLLSLENKQNFYSSVYRNCKPSN